MYDGGAVRLTHDGTIGEDVNPGKVHIDMLHIQDGGTFDLESDHIDTGFDIETEKTTVSSQDKLLS